MSAPSLDECDKPRGERCEIAMSHGTMLSEIVKWKRENGEYRIGIWNVASPFHVGGSVIRGGEGVEELLCRCTTLYPCMDTEDIRQQFYDVNRLSEDDEYSDSYIYIPDVVCVREGLEENWLEDEKQYTFDVISCTIPEIWKDDIVESRIEAMLCVAVKHKMDVLVLGVSEVQDEWMRLYRKALRKYENFLRAVCFVKNDLFPL